MVSVTRWPRGDCSEIVVEDKSKREDADQKSGRQKSVRGRVEAKEQSEQS